MIFWLAHAFSQMSGTHATARLNRVIVAMVTLITYAAIIGLCGIMALRQTAIDRIIALTGHIVIKAPYATLNTVALQSLLTTEYPEVAHATGYRFAYATLEHPRTHTTTPSIIRITTLQDEQKTTGLLAETNNTPIHHDGIYISTTLSRRLQCTSGGLLTMHFFCPDHTEPTITTISKIPIRGLLATKDAQDQTTLVLMPKELAEMHEIQSQPTHMALRLRQPDQLEKVVQRLTNRIQPLHVFPWYQLFPSLQEALALEAIAACAGLALLLLIAGIAIFGCCTMLLHAHQDQNTRLAQWGLSKARICALYTTYITLLTGIGICIGTSTAYITCILGTRYFASTLTQFSGIDTTLFLPNPLGVALIVCVVICMAIIACISSLLLHKQHVL